MTLSVDYMPLSLDEIAGNEAGIKSLRSKLTSDDIPRSYFFTGDPGCGKTTLAYVIKEELKISNFDFHEYDTANTRGIDTIREIRANISNAPMGGELKMYLLDEAHQITGAAMEALLKILYDPPEHTIIVLCTYSPEKINDKTLRAIRRRCFELELKTLRRGQIIKLLKEILEAEEVIDYPQTILDKIAKSCWGSPGQALSMLDAVIDMETEEEALEALENQMVSEVAINEMIRILIDGRISASSKWSQIKEMLPKIKGDPETIRYAICNYLNKVILGRPLDMRLYEIASFFTDSWMYTGKIGLSMACALACRSTAVYQSEHAEEPKTLKQLTEEKDLEEDIPF